MTLKSHQIFKERYARGPVEKKDLPKDAKVSGIMTKAKPNGSVRVILNLSAPVGRSVNEGIDNSQFPATMSSQIFILASNSPCITFSVEFDTLNVEFC